MTPEQKEVFHLTQRVIDLENKRAGDKATTETLIEEVGKLNERVSILEEARKVQIKLNAQFGAKEQPEDVSSFWDIFKRN